MTIRTDAPASTDPSLRYPRGTIPALALLLDELGEARIRYCMWKSNEHLAEGLAGRTDLDILVDDEQAPAFLAALARHRVKRLVPPPRAAFPGMEHYLGFDPGSGRLFHLHVHYRLVLGEKYVKNYRLPMEREFLASVRHLDGVAVPSPGLELGVLAARALLKYRPRDAVKDVLGIRTPGVPEPVRAEIRWLLAKTTIQEVRASLGTGGGVISPSIAGEFLETYARDPRAGATFFLLRQRLRSALRGRQRRRRTAATAEYVATAWSRRRRLRRAPAETRMKLADGGATIALIGADGSGKSTIAAELSEWLGWKLQVRSYYLGSKAPSPLGRASYLAFRAFRRGHRSVGGGSRIGSAAAVPLAGVRDALLAVHHVSNARDRLRRYERGRREAREGRIVIFDRFPMEAVSSTPEHRLLDGPQIDAVLGEPRGIARGLATLERRIYRKFALPDHLVALHVSPEVSFGRKPDHRPEVLAAKGRAVLELAERVQHGARSIVGVIRIDADAPLGGVLQQLKARLWDVL